VEAAVHREVDAAVVLGPAANPTAEVVFAFDDVDGDPALSQSGRGTQSRDSAADDGHAGA
jgi:hypothetical protein